MAKKTSVSRVNLILLTICIFLVGIVLGIFMKDKRVFDPETNTIRMDGKTFVPVEALPEDFKTSLSEENEFVVSEGKTWIPVEGEPVEVLVVNDETCGIFCDSAQAISVLQQVLTPALLVRNIDIYSDEGIALQETFAIETLPAFVLGSGVASLQREGESVLEQLTSFVTEKEGMYLMNSSLVGFPIGKYIELPEIDTVGEPSIGNGKVRVVEFTDFQCPYSKSLHDQNKELIDQLVEEGTIQYIVKDFPLAFHKESATIHTLANCVQRLAGDEAYFTAKNTFFETQEVWSGKGESGIESVLGDLINGLGISEDSLQECVNDPVIRAEIAQDIAEGQQAGVSGTPTVFIGKLRVPGAVNPEMFEEAVKNAE